MTYRALLIGNSVFDADAGLNPLNAPTKDVARLHRALVDSATGLFAEESVRLVVERSSHDLLDELDTFFSAAHRDDLLLLYYSGHGLLDERNQLFLCGRNTRSDKLLRTAVSNVRINEFIEQSVARCTVIILDCCSSGMFKGGDVSAPLAGPGRYVVSSTRGAALANDAAVATGTSLFTEHLVTGLLGAADDRDGDGFLDLREIFDYVRTQLTTTTKQIPHCRFDGDAAVVLAKRAAAPAPAGAATAAGSGDPSFVLSENMVTLRDVGPDERLSPEVIDIYPLTDAAVDCTAETDAAWLTAEVGGGQLTITLHPHPGHNRGKIVVRDRGSGTAQVVRVHVTVERRTDDPAPRPSAPSPSGMVPPAPNPPGPVPPARALARVPMPHAVEPPGPPGGGGRRRRWLLGAAAAALLSTGLVITGAAGLLSRPDGPSPTGTTPAAEPSPVTTASPTTGTTGTTAKRIRVPALGSTRESAKAALRAVGLFARFKERSSTEPEGQVIGSEPGHGARVRAGATVTVLLSSGGPRIVPDVHGMSADTARAALINADLESEIQEVSSDQPPGTVVGQSLPPGAEVARGTTVTLEVAAEPSAKVTPSEPSP